MNPKRRLKLLALGAVIGVLSLGLFLEFRVLIVRRVICQVSDGRPCPDKLLIRLDSFKGKSLFSPQLKSPSALSLGLMGFNLSHYQIDLNGQINLQLSPKAPVVSLKDPSNQSWLLVTDDGSFIGVVASPAAETTTVTYANTFQPGKSLAGSTLLPFIVNLINAFHQRGVPIETLTLYHDTVIAARLPDSKQAIFSSLSPITRQVASLQVILTQATISIDTPVIDVRFDKPVLRAAIPGQSSISVESNQ